jgi:anhydro-N-acetylmuramic acid kinase
MRVLGIMSGSSLDGLDMALCRFTSEGSPIAYEVLSFGSAPMPPELYDRLLHMSQASAFDMARTHTDLGRFIGECAKALLDKAGGADLITSHGHTVFHQPKAGFTTQLGCGAQIAAITGTPTVVDLRTKDVALGGQGAPLVPIGERDLFSGHDGFVNLGGIANSSVHRDDLLVGSDVCFCNQALNFLANEAGKAYDDRGALASAGTLNEALLARLAEMPFLRQSPPFTLGREHFETEMRPMLTDSTIPLVDRLFTTAEHIAQLISGAMQAATVKRCLVTGGGAHNHHLVERMRTYANTEFVIPEDRIVDLKEAIIFAYLGWLRWHARPNALASVTGAARDSIGGALYLPN